MHVSSLHLYPVKSLRGCDVTAADLDALGFVGDRRFLVVDPTGKFLTQRTLPRMALIATALSGDRLTLSADGAGSVSTGRASDPQAPLRVVTIWRSENLQAEDCGDAVAGWLSDFLALPCRLVRIGGKFRRPVLKAAAQPEDVTTFADAVPFLVVSEASLADLNDRLIAQGEAPVPMNRFRPNIVIAGAPAAFAEDTWPHMRIGGIVLRSAGPSARCIVTTTDQFTGERGIEPLRTLASYRRRAGEPSAVDFGHNFIHETKVGAIRVGDAVTCL